MNARRIEPATALVAAAIAATSVVFLVWFTELTFWRDEWAVLLHRRGFNADAFLAPHYEHVLISLTAVYKALQATFGMDSPRPFQVAAVAGFATSVALLFVYARRRAGGWIALAGCLPILVLGPAWDVLLWPFQLVFFGSMSAGLGALLLAERAGRASAIGATCLLVLSLTFSSLGIAFAVGIAVALALRRELRSRWFVIVIPAAIFALWWLGWGHEARDSVSFSNLANLAGYVLDGFASSLASLLGFTTPFSTTESPLDWGRPLLVVAVALGAWRVSRLERVPTTLLVVLAIAISFWALAGANASIFREATTGRYQYMGAVFWVMIGAELLRGIRLRPPAIAAILAAAALAALANLNSLHDAYGGLKRFGYLQPAGLGALEIIRDQVDPAFELTEENSGVDYLGELDAGSYLSAVDAFGSPALTPGELEGAPAEARLAADQVMVAGLGLELGPVARPPVGACAAPVTVTGDTPAEIELPLGGAVLAASGGPLEVGLRRYSEEPVSVGTLGDGAVALAIPPDRSSRPWVAELDGSGAVSICESQG